MKTNQPLAKHETQVTNNLWFRVTFSPQKGHQPNCQLFKGDQFFLLTRNAMEAVFSVSRGKIWLDVFPRAGRKGWSVGLSFLLTTIIYFQKMVMFDQSPPGADVWRNPFMKKRWMEVFLPGFFFKAHLRLSHDFLVYLVCIGYAPFPEIVTTIFQAR